MLTYKKTENLEVVGYSDADFAGCVDTKKSTSGCVFMLANGAISWKSSKQSLTAASTRCKLSSWHVMRPLGKLCSLRVLFPD